MWGSVLGMSLLAALNPVLLGIILVIISRPRPVQSLLAFWVGAMLTNLPAFVVPLVLLHVTPAFASFAQDFAAPTTVTSSAVRPFPLGTGVVLLMVTAAMTVRLRSRLRADLPRSGGDASQGTPKLIASTASSGPVGRVKSAALRVAGKVQQLYGHLTSAWENGSLRFTVAFGMLYIPSLTLVLLVDTTIATSGAGRREQFAAAIAFVLGFLALLEITLLSYAVAPRRTAAVLQPLHQWARTHNLQILIAFFALVATWQMARGFGIV
jgi:hypothetical protein